MHKGNPMARIQIPQFELFWVNLQFFSYFAFQTINIKK